MESWSHLQAAWHSCCTALLKLASWASWYSTAITAIRNGLVLGAAVFAWTLYWLGCSQMDTILPVLCHWSCFLGLLSILHLSSGLFPVGWCWRIVSKTRQQSSSILDSPGWKDYFTCPEGFSPVYTSSRLFAFFLMVFTVDWVSAYDPDLPLQDVFWDSGVTILDLETDVFPKA